LHLVVVGLLLSDFETGGGQHRSAKLDLHVVSDLVRDELLK
jgi:hypothetical protein